MQPVELPHDGFSNDYVKHIAGDWGKNYGMTVAGFH